jgi:hypothetical protein
MAAYGSESSHSDSALQTAGFDPTETFTSFWAQRSYAFVSVEVC